MLSIKNYSKSYHDIEVLSIDTLQLRSGIYWIKGENGSGKSTLFKSIAGIIPFDGDIIFQNADVKKNPVAYRRLVHYAEAEPQYPGFLTAKDLVRFVGRSRGVKLAEQGQCISNFGVDSFFEKPCQTFSSGMMKKLSLVLAFLGNTPLIILDEPLITLDSRARETLLAEIKKRASTGTTFLLSSHQSLEESDFPLSGTFQIKQRKLIRDGAH